MKKLTMFLMAVMFATIFFVNTAFAIEENEVILQTESDWITAGGASATISAFITNTSYSIQSVDFACLQADIYGDVVTKRVTSPPYLTSFSSTKSGTADIQAIINYLDSEGSPGSVTKTIQQKIDHAEPDAILNITYSNEVTVGEITSFDVRMTDFYGNLIDSKREDDEGSGLPEYITLYCSPSNSYLYDGTGYTLHSAAVYVNSEGVAETSYQVSTEAGENLITIYNTYGIGSEGKTIRSVADAEPVSIDVSVNPNNGVPPFLPADGESKFYIKYYLTDQYGNPAGNRTLDISSSDPDYIIGERTSNSEGVINISYGPIYQKNIYTVTAFSLDNPSLSVQTNLQFDSTDPVNMLLTANPEVMPSHEVAPTRTSAIRAKVMDERGNPVENEVVTFSIIDGSYPVYQTVDPSLSATTATTDEDGQAIVDFTSGTFIYDTLDPDYESAGSATCTVQAEWNSIERTILLEWKNYPYLSVETEVNPETVAVNSTVDVTIRLIGDGWALQPTPIDVMLSADRSGSMLMDYTPVSSPDDRMVDTMEAMKEFNYYMVEGRDRVGLTTFGNYGLTDIMNYYAKYWAGDDGYYLRDDGYYDHRGKYHEIWTVVSYPDDDLSYVNAHYEENGRTYSDYATLDVNLIEGKLQSAVDSEIDNIVPMGGTPMRKGIYLAIKEIADNGRDDAVRAVIVLSDGDYNYYGDPLARGTGSDYYYATSYGDLTLNYYKFGLNDPYDPDPDPNLEDMAEYAKANNVKIYTIAFGNGLSTEGLYTLDQLAERTGGLNFSADSTNINDVYLEIAGELKTDAGVNTQMTLDFQNIEINNVSTSNSDSSKLRYINIENVSTVIEKWNQTDTVIPRYTVDDTDDWSEDQALDFDVGTVKLLETWETTFRLRVLADGNINIFGPGSTITFNNGTDSLELPITYVTGVYNLTVTGTEFKDLSVSDLHSTNTGEITDTLDLEWTIFYSGESSAQQTLYYLKSGDDVWIPFKTMTGVSGPLTSGITQNANLAIRDFPPGNYNIRVRASSMDTADSVVEMTAPVKIGEHTATYIKIE